MKLGITIVLVFGLVAAAGWWILQGEAVTREQRNDAPAPTVSQENEQLDEDRTPGGAESHKIDAARQRVKDATLALEAAIAQRKAAETDLQTAEQAVEELERWVADIEARGEDPIDYADEGLAKLQPAFFAYQDAFERFELSESMQAAATEELAAANASLSRAMAASVDEE